VAYPHGLPENVEKVHITVGEELIPDVVACDGEVHACIGDLLDGSRTPPPRCALGMVIPILEPHVHHGQGDDIKTDFPAELERLGPSSGRLARERAAVATDDLPREIVPGYCLSDTPKTGRLGVAILIYVEIEVEASRGGHTNNFVEKRRQLIAACGHIVHAFASILSTAHGTPEHPAALFDEILRE